MSAEPPVRPVALRIRWLVVGLSFVWMAFVYASFYLVREQRPLNTANLRAVGGTMLDLLVVGAILVIAAGLGAWICRWLGLSFAHPGELLVWGAGLGLGVVSLAIFGIGLAGWLTRPAMVVLLLILALVALPRLRDLWPALVALRSVGLPGWGLRVYLAAMLLLTLAVALAPPWDWDGLLYHLTLPRLYIEQGRIAPVTDMAPQYYPSLVEMLYLAAMALRGDTAAKLFHMAYLVLMGGGVYLLAARHLRSGTGWPAVALYAATPMIFVLGGWAYTDLALAFYPIAALYALLQWWEEGTQRWLVLCAVYCGLALGIKYTAWSCLLAAGLLVAWRLWRTAAPIGRWWRCLLLLGGIAVAVAAPWYLRSLALTGDPVYPFLRGLVSGSERDAWRAAWYARPGTGLGWDAGALLALPWTLTLGIKDVNFWDGRTGPLYLLLLPFVILWGVGLFGRRPRGAGPMLFFGLIQFGFWTAGVISTRSLFQTRLLLPALVPFCAPMACLIEDLRALDTRHLSLRRLVVMSLALVLGANLVYQFYWTVRIQPLSVLVGEESRVEFARRNLGTYYGAMEAINTHVPAGGRVLFLWEPRSYYCVRDVQPDLFLERWAWLRHQSGDDLDALAYVLRQEGYTHVLLYEEGLVRARQIEFDPIADADVAALGDLLQRYGEPVASVEQAYTLYRLQFESGQNDG